MTESPSTTTRRPSSTGALTPGRRVVVDGIATPSGRAELGTIIHVTEVATATDRAPWEYVVQLEETTRTTIPVQPRHVTPAAPTPAPVAVDESAVMAAARWIARQNGAEHVLDGSYNDAEYRTYVEAARDLLRTVDDARRGPRPCRFTWKPYEPLGESRGDVVYGCAFHAEPRSRACGIHTAYVAAYGWPSSVPVDQADELVEPVGPFDPFQQYMVLTRRAASA